jgi:gluconate 2-dehydrogenase gamma chain
MQRRTALGILTGSAVAPGLGNAAARDSGHVHAASQPERSGELLFFSDQEDALLDRLAEMIIPADSRSGGAHDAKVSRDIDHVVAYSSARVQDNWRAQLKAVDEEAKRRFGKAFVQCDAASQDTLMAEWAKNEKAPKTELERFFVEIKRSTAAGYYTSEIGVLKELGFKGNDVLKEFPGCKQPCKICSL